MTPPEADAKQDMATIVRLMGQLAPREGYNLTALPNVRVLRSDRVLEHTPVLYDPGIVIVGQGTKRGWFGDQVFVYDARHYLAVAVPVPFTMQSDSTPARPLLALYLHLELPVVADVMLQLEQHGEVAAPSVPCSLVSSPMDADMRATVVRLLQVLSRPLESALFGGAVLRELYFRVLTGPQGPALRAALTMNGTHGRIGKALRRIHADYAGPLDLPTLAREAGMSVPSFHSHFRAITQTSPMQYVKSIRLHQARLLMLRASITAAAAAHEVGYQSTSQFSREFKRLFGRPPLDEVQRMKASFGLPPQPVGNGFVSSH